MNIQLPFSLASSCFRATLLRYLALALIFLLFLALLLGHFLDQMLGFSSYIGSGQSFLVFEVWLDLHASYSHLCQVLDPLDDSSLIKYLAKRSIFVCSLILLCKYVHNFSALPNFSLDCKGIMASLLCMWNCNLFSSDP